MEESKAATTMARAAEEIKLNSIQETEQNLEGQPSLPSTERPTLSFPATIGLTLVLASSSFLNTAITQACIIVLPTIGRDLDIPSGNLQWVLSAASVAYGGTLALWGRLADIWGRRFIFRLGLASISLSCLIAPFAPEQISFDVFRALQGLGGAAATPIAVGIIFAVFPPGKGQIYAMSAFSAGFPLGNIMGCILGGIIAQNMSWHWIFWIMCIVSACSLAASLIVIPPLAKDIELRAIPFRKLLRHLAVEMDWVGLVLLITVLILLLVGLTEGNVVGWKSPLVITLLIVSCLLFPLFIYWERRLERLGVKPPVVKLSIFDSSSYCAAQAISFTFWTAFSNFLVFATYFFQDYQGLSIIQTTLRFLPSGITGIITVFISSQILSRVNSHYVAVWGTVCISIPCLLFAVPIPPSPSYWAYGFPAMIILTLGGDTLYPCLSLFVMKSIPHENQAMGAAIFQMLGQVGRTIGLAIATAIHLAVAGSHEGSIVVNKEAYLRGLRAANGFSFGIGCIAVVTAAYAFKGAGKLGK